MDGHKITPYLSCELSYDSRFSQWNRQRYYAGVVTGVNRHLSLDTYYMRQHDSRSAPHHLNVVYEGLKLRF